TGSDVGSTSALVLDGVVVGPEDETGIGNGFSPQFDPAIISRIGVLKGPQGTLYGGSTLGGLVMYETVKPTQNAWAVITSFVRMSALQSFRISSAFRSPRMRTTLAVS